MISASLPPYSNYSSAPIKPLAQKGGSEPETRNIPGANGAGAAATADQPAKSGRSKPGLSKQDSTQSAQDQKRIAELKKIDSNVRAHEQAHLAAAGGLAMSGATFTYTRGPDGQQYAVGGEVSIDVSPGKTPRETIDKAERIKAAALAPADPSAQDRAVAGAAAQMEAQAQQQLAQEKLDAAQGKGSESDATVTSSQQKTETSGGASAFHGIASYRSQNAASDAPGRYIDFTA
ncbi:MAG: putative metalloprotease CJM1_0395 family protein [Sulfuricellaceae bacterium]